jgi:drug/metabolite transporter (DMT)-like permease
MSRSSWDGLVDSVLIAAPGLIWGASFLFIAEGLASTSAYGVAFARIAIGFLTLMLVPAARRPIAAVDRRGIVALGTLWFAFPCTMFPMAEQHVSSALTGMLNAATPLFTAVVAAIIARRLPGAATVKGLVLGFTGAVLMALPGATSIGGTRTGILLILAALASYGVAFNLARRLQQRNGALAVTRAALGVALVLTAPLGLPAVASAHWSARAILALLALGVLGTGVATALAAMAAGRLGSTRASASTFIIPVGALVLGVVVRNETVALVSIAGVAVCLTGAWLLRRAQHDQPRVAPMSPARVPSGVCATES